eukprot:CAMPEP_0114581586 /NCGR_PEP_ID=MMETSP0125-20121206/5677_1 /TAXON_ID=485358 ORGANISM="Aristerostoma sp., Strain ATCC 50986" /NCGR_SAMPLE_ID=MMETSP0125 /ASSEMBLY_ACC=CAM_ASM_000245 /LENGTH=89 /DNA_ID=CAMNT_0001773907 /DNA_START=245 /DNA_END=514 /DNA_ORIENTATION=-
MYYKDAKAAILVYDITSADSFSSVEYWVDALKEHLSDDNLLTFLVGNKKDAAEARAITTQRGEKFAKENKMIFTEVSAKSGEGVKEMFD